MGSEGLRVSFTADVKIQVDNFSKWKMDWKKNVQSIVWRETINFLVHIIKSWQ